MNTSMHTFSQLTLMVGFALGGMSANAVAQAPGTPPASAGWQPAAVSNSECAAAAAAVARAGETGGCEAASAYRAADALPMSNDDGAYTAAPTQFPPATEGLHGSLPAAVRVDLFQVPSATTYVDVGRRIGEREADLVQGYIVPLPASIAPAAELADMPAAQRPAAAGPAPADPRDESAVAADPAATRINATPPRR